MLRSKMAYLDKIYAIKLARYKYNPESVDYSYVILQPISNKYDFVLLN